MSKQDRQGVRNATDIERKYNFDKNFATVMGIATDAQRAAERLRSDIDAELSLKVSVDDNDKIVSMINASADNVKIKAEKLDIEGKELNIKVKSTNIVGKVTADQVEAENLKVKSANIEGTLTASQIDATNLKVKAANIEGELTADQINANGLEVIKGKIGGWTLGECQIPIGTASTVTVIPDGAVNIGNIIYKYEIALYSGQQTELVSDNVYYTYETWLTASGVSIASKYYAEGGGSSPTEYTTKTWRQILAGS